MATAGRQSGRWNGKGRASVAEDIVAGVLRQWQKVHPGLNTGPMAVIGRLNRCAALLQQAVDAPLAQEGLSRPEFDILGTLRRTGRELTPGQIARETFASGAAVTKRLRVLEDRGLVSRRADERDRRVAHLRLTDAGRDLIDRLLPDQLSFEETLLSGLSPEDLDDLSETLSDLLLHLEGRLRTPRP